MERFAVKSTAAAVPISPNNGGQMKEIRSIRMGSTSSMDSTHSSSIYRKSYPNSDTNASFSSTSVAGSIQDDNISEQRSLTQAELEEYSRSYFGQHLFLHQKQSSYAQSEGYHSYVSSSDSSSATPFLDRLRQESELLSRSSHWSQSDLQSTSSTNNNNNTNSNNNASDNNSSESTSSSETLKWLGSMSDVSVASHATNSSTVSGSVSSSQLIVHSSRVRTPKRHNSESVLYMDDDQIQISLEENKENSPKDRSSRSNHRLFPVGTYSEPTLANADATSPTVVASKSHSQQQNWQSVADRISELEKQHCNQSQGQTQNQKYTYLDPSKTTRVPNPTLKAFQKNAVKSYFERQQTSAKEAARNSTSMSSNNYNPIPRPQSLPITKTVVAKQPMNPRISLPTNFAQMNNYTNTTTTTSTNSIISSSVIAQPVQCTKMPSPILAKSTVSPIKMLSSPSYQATFHQSASTYNVSITPAPPPPSLLGRGNNNMDRKDLFCSPIFMNNSLNALSDLGSMQYANESGIPPPPPRRDKSLMPLRRTSSASEYVSFRDQNIQKQSLSKDLLGPMVMGPIILLDDWVPERPPKNPMLRIPSPDLPPPPPANYIEDGSGIFNSDEPLPPPPPELLRHMRQYSDLENKATTANRRNSFAGSTVKKPSAVRNLRVDGLSSQALPPQQPPPIVPKKPSANDRLHQQQRPLSSLSKHKPIILKPQKVILNGKMEPPQAPLSIGATDAASRLSDTRISLRKRTHNAQMPLEIASSTNCKMIVSPPPLKPRLSINPSDLSNRSPSSAQGNRLRCNSKASYLPRQTREKPTNDPDHGSYKLTLTSNEDCINQTNPFQEEILSGKCSNLPDVLPMGVKVQTSQRYGSQNSLNNNNSNVNSNMIIPQTAPALSNSFSMKPLFHFSLNNNVRNTSPTIPPYSRSTSESISPKYMSQSTIDLKKTHILSNGDTNNKIMSSESEQNLTDTNGKLSPYAMRNEFVRKMSLDDPAAHSSPPTFSRPCSMPPKSDNRPIRKDSLKENIDKITQLQTKLMSAHLSENERIVPNLCRDSSYRSSTTKIDSIPMNANEDDAEDEVVKVDNTHHNIETVNSSESAILTATPVVVAEITETTISSSNSSNEIDTTRMVQRTEIVLRLNAPTIEAASQTDDTLDVVPMIPAIESIEDDTIHTSGLHATDDHDFEKLSKELISQLSPSDRLYHILAPKDLRYPSDYVTGLYNPYIRPRLVKKDVATSVPELSSDHMKCGDENSDSPNTTPLPIPESKPVQRYNREIKTLVNGDSGSLTKQKEELVDRIGQKLYILNGEQTIIGEESTANELLGNDIAIKVTQTIRPIDASKFRCYVDDVGHITMLLLSLSGRLAKIENSLQTTISDIEKKTLETKRDRLIEQLEEAKLLKVDIDRRGGVIAKILEKHLSIDDYADYDYFINMKAKLIVDAREIADKIKLSEEQLAALKDTLVQSEC